MADATRIPDFLNVASALIIENSAKEAEYLAKLCKRSFEMSTQIQLLVESGAAAVMSRLDAALAITPLNSVAFLDICLDDSPTDHSGLTVAERIREKRLDLPIIVYSLRADRQVAIDLVLTGVVDDVVDKELIRDNRLSSTAFNAIVDRAMRKREPWRRRPVQLTPSEGGHEPDSDTDEWLAVEVISRVGETDLSHLIGLCVEGAVSAQLSYMAPGLSGSFVISARIKRASAANVDVVLKVGRDKQSLEADHKHIVDVGSWPGRLVPHLRPEGVQALNGWYAYAMENVPGTPLSARIGHAGATELVATAFDSIRPLYQPSTTSCKPLGTLRWSRAERANTIIEIRRLTPFLARRRPTAAALIEPMLVSVASGGLPGISDARLESLFGELPCILQHGDLHMGNIMVDDSTRALDVRLIDWSRYGTYPLAMDFAKCEASFRLRMVDSIDCFDCDVARIEKWEEVDTAIHTPGKALDSGLTHLKTNQWNQLIALIRQEAARQVNAETSSITRSRLEAWYYFCLFRSYLKGVGAENVETPKRLWAFVTAAKLAQALAERL